MGSSLVYLGCDPCRTLNEYVMKHSANSTMKKWITKVDLIEAILLLLVAVCFSIPQYWNIPPYVLLFGTALLSFMPLFFILTYKNYGIIQLNPTRGFLWLMYIWSFVFKCLAITTFVLSFSEMNWVGDIANRSTVMSILYVINRLLMIPYFIICLYKKAFKEALVCFIYDLYYQLLGPALTFFVFH